MNGEYRSLLRRTVFVFLLLLAPYAVFAQVLDRPVAVVRLTETTSIGQRELRQQIELLESQIGRTLNDAQRGEVLEAQIGDVLLNQAAERANVRVTQAEIDQAVAMQRQSLGQPVSETQFRQVVEQQMGMSWETYLNELENRLVQEQFILERARGRFGEIGEPSEREIRQVYEENAQQFTNPAMVRFDHLFFDLRQKGGEEAIEVRRLAGVTANEVARDTQRFTEKVRQSVDDARFSGGDFGYILRGDTQAVGRLGQQFVDELFDLDDGEVSLVIESNVGLHVVRVTDRRSPRLLQLDDPLLPGESITVRQQIRTYILNQRQQQIFQESVAAVLAELKEEADITRYPENLAW